MNTWDSKQPPSEVACEVWDLASGASICGFTVPLGTKLHAFSPDSAFICASYTEYHGFLGAPSVLIYDALTGKRLVVVGCGDMLELESVCWTSCGCSLLVVPVFEEACARFMTFARAST